MVEKKADGPQRPSARRSIWRIIGWSLAVLAGLYAVLFGGVVLVNLLVRCFIPDSDYEQLLYPESSPPSDIGALVYIEGGTFTMGAPPNAESKPNVPMRWLEGARPTHEETVPSFEIGKYEVTAREYCGFLNELLAAGEDVAEYADVDLSKTWKTITREGEQYAPQPGYEYAPALHVSYRGARRYCQWLSEKTGDRYRLPSEVEWEYTARGKEGRTYPWGEESPVGRAFLWIHYHPSYTINVRKLLGDPSCQKEAPKYANVGTFPEGATPEGVHDLIGNADEWCGNYHHDYSETSITADPERFAEYVFPPLPSAPSAEEEKSSDFWRSCPMAVKRGGQYLTAHQPATGWSRYSGGPAYLTWGRDPTTFRVLREIDDETTSDPPQ